MRIRPVVLIIIHLLLFTGGTFSFSYVFGQSGVADSLSSGPQDSLITAGDSLAGLDSLAGGNDSLQTKGRTYLLDSLAEKSDLKSEVEYHATDSIVFDINNRILYLYSSGEDEDERPNLKYEDISLKADSIVVDWENTTLTAEGKLDTLGNISGQPEFTESEQLYSAKKIAYNFKTQRGRIQLARMDDDGEIIHGEVIKKDSGDVYRIKNGMFTTCDADTPHFHIRSAKLKVLPGDRIISGPLMLVIEQFPLPIVVPFGFFPNNTTRQSGILMPEWGESQQRGFFLRNGGYFWAINDSVDLELRGDIFSKGGFRVMAASHYNVRYKFSGSISWQTGFQKFGEKWGSESWQQDENYSTSLSHKFNWFHDQKLGPGGTLKAKVDIGSSDFNRLNSYNTQDYLSATLTSNVTYSQAFIGSPYRLTVSLNHNQNTQTRQMTLGLPTVAFTKKYDNPFKSKKGISKNAWYEKIGYSYSFNLNNQVTAPDSVIFQALTQPNQDVELVTISTENDSTVYDTTFRQGSEFFKNGIRHTIPVNASFTAFKYVNITPSLNYNEFWYFSTQEKVWNETTEEIETNTIPGFATARSFNANANASTRLYMFNQFPKSKRDITFRTMINPSVGYTYKPDYTTDFWGYYREVQSDTLGNTTEYSRFSNGIYGGPSGQESQLITFGLNGTWEMKYKSLKEDTSRGDKPAEPVRITLLDNIRVSSNYNFAADSLNLAPFSMSARTSLFQKKVNIQLDATMNPYAVNEETGAIINEYMWDRNRSLGRITRAGIRVNTGFRSKKSVGKKRYDRLDPAKYADVMALREAYVDFSVPWSVNFTYNLSYTDNGITKDTVQSLNINGDFNLTPKWKFTYRTGYDFSNRDFTFTQFTIYRDMHCWEMSFNWVPFGNRQSYTFGLNVKNPTLKDLKLTKRSDWQDFR